MASSDQSDWSSSFIILKNVYILKFSVNGIINIILHDLINLYAQILEYESLYDCTRIFIGNIYNLKVILFCYFLIIYIFYTLCLCEYMLYS